MRGKVDVSATFFLLGFISLHSVVSAEEFPKPGAAPSTSAAAPPVAPAESDITSELYKLDEILNREIFVASKSNEGLKDAPSSVTVFTAEEIRQLGVQELDDLLNFVPGFQTTRDIEQGQTTRISARGRGSALSESVLILVDGQRLNDLYTGGASVINPHITLQNAKQVEVIRGPGSALYGSNAFLGVVNIITDSSSTRIQAQGGSFLSRRAAASASQKFLNNEVSVSGFVGAFADNGATFNNATGTFGVSGNTRDPYSGLDANVAVSWRGLTLRFRHTDRQNTGFLTFGPVQSVDPKKSFENTSQNSIAAAYQAQLGEKMELDFTASYSRDTWKAVEILVPANVEIAPGFSLSEPFMGGPLIEMYSLRGAADARYKLLENNQLSAGVSFERAQLTKVLNLADHDYFTLDYLGGVQELPQSLSFNVTIPRNILGVYVQDKHRIGDYLSLTVGVRYDNYSDFGDSINPRLAAVVHTPFGSTLRLGYGKAFRAPSYTEFYDRTNPVDFGNQSLKAEDVNTIEAAVSQSYGDRINASLVYFHNRLSNLIALGDPVASPDNPLNAPTFFNRRAVLTTQGLEAELTIIPLDRLTVKGTATYFFGPHDELQVPPLFGSAIVNYRVWRFNLNASAVYRQSMPEVLGQRAYCLLNSAVSFDVVDKLQVQLIARNLLDISYRTITTVFPDGVPNRGRTFFVGASYSL